MITQKQPLTGLLWPFPQQIAPESSLFLDIETTGFLPGRSHLYLIGAVYCSRGTWYTMQWMCENPSEEASLLRVFAMFVRSYRILLHFNGMRFDLPYLKEKYAQYQMKDPFSSLQSIDLYTCIRGLRKLLGLKHMNQKSLEQFLGLQREDTMNGGELIPVYRAFCREPDNSRLELLLLHNRDDLKGMCSLLPLLTYLALPGYPWPSTLLDLRDITPSLVCSSRTMVQPDSNATILELSMQLPWAVPVPIHKQNDICTLELRNAQALLTVPLFFGKLKYFFDHPQDYYYLPLEDQAIHKSVAVYVDPEHRVKATRETCYIPKEGCFLPMPPKGDFSPSYRRQWNDSIRFLELPWNDRTRKPNPPDPSFLAHYSELLMQMFFYTRERN